MRAGWQASYLKYLKANASKIDRNGALRRPVPRAAAQPLCQGSRGQTQKVFRHCTGRRSAQRADPTRALTPQMSLMRLVPQTPPRSDCYTPALNPVPARFSRLTHSARIDDELAARRPPGYAICPARGRIRNRSGRPFWHPHLAPSNCNPRVRLLSCQIRIRLTAVIFPKCSRATSSSSFFERRWTAFSYLS